LQGLGIGTGIGSPASPALRGDLKTSGDATLDALELAPLELCALEIVTRLAIVSGGGGHTVKTQTQDQNQNQNQNQAFAHGLRVTNLGSGGPGSWRLCQALATEVAAVDDIRTSLLEDRYGYGYGHGHGFECPVHVSSEDDWSKAVSAGPMVTPTRVGSSAVARPLM